MPPKKKDKKGDKNKEEKKVQPVDKSAVHEKEKDLIRNQNQLVQKQIFSCQATCDELRLQYKDLTQRCCALEQQILERSEYVDYYQRKKEQEVEQLMEQLASLKQACDQERDELLRQHGEEKQELQDIYDALAGEHRIVVTRLKDMEEFQKQKEKLLSDLKYMKEQLSSQDEEHKDAIHDLEIKSLLERKSFEKEIECQMEAKIQDEWENEVPMRTAIALQEIQELKKAYIQLLDETRMLMKDNSALKEKKSILKRDVDILEEMKSQVSLECCVQKKMEDQKKAECQQLQEKLADSYREVEELQNKLHRTQEDLETLRHDRVLEHEQQLRVRNEALRKEVELKQERRKRRNKENIMQEAAASLRDALMDEASVGISENIIVAQWKPLMMKLMVALESSNDDSLSSLQRMSL
ncbi:cilia- and flagella-associated protein 157-like [Synchiropus splendidus]|uniref:cilia- and flagella-associated protein 157-like n=1 Tax=Synchiropus splendidus TaxID=270530 RepID=UPI00237DE9C8|nr:cilia- and flagella-associated protein 157-like [Synchiropus splendidus]XP_053725725.1 cilia- and flagella-associated protein 157-like [Synchiropus splendidus]